jgi:protein subunit release factor A
MTHLPTGLKRVGASSRSRESNLLEARTALLADLDGMGAEMAAGQENSLRKRQIGSGMRGDKRRTYRFQDDAVVDHVTGKRAKATAFMRGQIERLW